MNMSEIESHFIEKNAFFERYRTVAAQASDDRFANPMGLPFMWLRFQP